MAQIQTQLLAFPEQVEKTTEFIEIMAPPRIQDEFKPKHDGIEAQEVAKRINKIWDSIYHYADFEQFLDMVLSALEQREADYMALVQKLDPKAVQAFANIYGELSAYFLDGNYGDPLGEFYMERFSHGAGGEFYTPFHVCYMMAIMLDPEPGQTICDPCSGSGRMLMAARCVIHEKYGWIESSRYGRNLYGTEISNRAVKMSKINILMTDYIYMICLTQNAVQEYMSKHPIKTSAGAV
jgi:type I restriction-modification system DNA methylase subunit